MYVLDECQALTSPHDNPPPHAPWLRGRRTIRWSEQRELIEEDWRREEEGEKEENRKTDTGKNNVIGNERKRQQCFSESKHATVSVSVSEETFAALGFTGERKGKKENREETED